MSDLKPVPASRVTGPVGVVTSPVRGDRVGLVVATVAGVVCVGTLIAGVVVLL